MRSAGWWGRTSVRLPLLLVLLVVVAYAGVPKIIRGASAGAAASCPEAPLTAQLPASDLRSLVARSQAASLIGEGRPDTQGLQQPTAAWSDSLPSPPSSHESNRVPGGYELRWWSLAQDHQAVDVFAFHGPAEAQRYVRAAAATRCRSGAVSYPLSAPAGARGLVWTNPVQSRQADVVFARGTHAYRVIEVAPDSYSHGVTALDDQDLVELAAHLACALADARCLPPQQAMTLSWAGYDALRQLMIGERELTADASPRANDVWRFAHQCLRRALAGDAESRLLATACKADVHVLEDQASSRSCHGTAKLSCQKLSIDAIAGDIERLSWVQGELARELSPGRCQSEFSASAAVDSREADALVLLGQGLGGHAPRLEALARDELSILSRRLTRQSRDPFEQLAACNPSATAARRAAST